MKEVAYLERVEVRIFGSKKSTLPQIRFQISVYDKLTKKKVVEYGKFKSDALDGDAYRFALERGITLA